MIADEDPDAGPKPSLHCPVLARGGEVGMRLAGSELVAGPGDTPEAIRALTADDGPRILMVQVDREIHDLSVAFEHIWVTQRLRPSRQSFKKTNVIAPVPNRWRSA